MSLLSLIGMYLQLSEYGLNAENCGVRSPHVCFGWSAQRLQSEHQMSKITGLQRALSNGSIFFFKFSYVIFRSFSSMV